MMMLMIILKARDEYGTDINGDEDDGHDDDDDDVDVNGVNGAYVNDDDNDDDGDDENLITMTISHNKVVNSVKVDLQNMTDNIN